MAFKRFEYDVEFVSADSFKKVVYFCNSDGECTAEQVPADQAERFTSHLNSRGEKGWELVQVLFSANGLMLVWKRERS
ncbi:MAG: hypothetical protein D6806_02955 [Deltaproteobacteria bacterium]|nr:MAG: hypothetical protein D6806_02955 [Deltaproteobacteria bacterium]